jgi:ATP-dependent DNA helicase DinG
MIGLKESFQEQPPRGELAPLVDAIFRPGGWMQTELGLDYRPQQAAMAVAAAQAFEGEYPLLFEAGTGVGKSLAYLVPGIIHATLQGRQCIVSTHTISLQEQLQENDLPLSRALFNKIPELAPFADFKTALLVGKANYLCNARLARAITTRGELFPSAVQTELERLTDWARVSATGIRHELTPPINPDVWEWVNADSGACNRRRCNPKTCFYQRARARMLNARVVIVNHSLLFSLMNAGAAPHGKTPGILLAKDFVVLDEAQTVPAVASQQFGHHVSSVGLDRLLKRFFNPRHKKGILRRLGSLEDCRIAEEAIATAKQFFTDVRHRILAAQPIVRIYSEGWGEPVLNPPLVNLVQRTAAIADRLADGPEREELQDLGERVKQYNMAINACLSVASEESVYWLERTGRDGNNVHMRATPLDVAAVLREHIFNRSTSALLTSATLDDGTGMNGFMEKVGAFGAIAEQVRSPFDYDRTVRIFIASDAPPPDRENARLDVGFLSESIRACALAVGGGTLVLFTSYHDMRQVAERVENDFQKAGRRFLMQGRDGPRSLITNQFREAGNAILLGADSFWKGVDVPGAALSQVIVTRLPFENPSHPVAGAKQDWIRSRGGNPFAEMTLPDAVIKLRQGIGRLIRSESDRGTITLLDSRLLTRPYGRFFLDVLPKREFTTFNRENREAVFSPLENA